MATKTIRVRGATKPTLTFKLTKFRDESQPDAVQDITGYAFRFRARRTTENDKGEPVETELFEVAGAIVTATAGSFKFDLTTEQTSLPPARYPGEIVWWASGTPGTDVPTDAWDVEYIVEEALDVP